MKVAVALASIALISVGGSALAQEKKLTPVSYTLNWYPQAEHGGAFQAKADGVYEENGLDVLVQPGGPQINIHQLLPPRQTDFIMGTGLRSLPPVPQGAPIATVFSALPKGAITP